MADQRAEIQAYCFDGTFAGRTIERIYLPKGLEKTYNSIFSSGDLILSRDSERIVPPEIIWMKEISEKKMEEITGGKSHSLYGDLNANRYIEDDEYRGIFVPDPRTVLILATSKGRALGEWKNIALHAKSAYESEYGVVGILPGPNAEDELNKIFEQFSRVD